MRRDIDTNGINHLKQLPHSIPHGIHTQCTQSESCGGNQTIILDHYEDCTFIIIMSD